MTQSTSKPTPTFTLVNGISEDTDPERESMSFGAKVGLVFLICTSAAIAVGVIGWVIGVVT